VLFTDNTEDDIGRVFLTLIEEYVDLAGDMEKIAKELIVDWQSKADILTKKIGQWL